MGEWFLKYYIQMYRLGCTVKHEYLCLSLPQAIKSLNDCRLFLYSNPSLKDPFIQFLS